MHHPTYPNLFSETEIAGIHLRNRNMTVDGIGFDLDLHSGRISIRQSV